MKFSLRREVAGLRDVDSGLPLALVAFLIALHGLFLWRGAADSDEAQHLHVIYAWLHGAVPYLDVFDNHTPFFHWLFLPLARLAGETPEIILWARLAQIPISFGLLGMLYFLGRRLYGRAVALWTVVLALALGDWALKSVEFRPDVLWTFCWFAALLALARPPGWRSFFLAGLLLGLALMTSVKTSFLLAGLGLGWAGAWLVVPAFREAYSVRKIGECAVSGAAGFAIVPLLGLGWFSRQHALEAMRYCLFTVNQPEAPQSWRIVVAVAGMLAALWIGRRIGRESGERAAVFLSAAFYALLIVGFSPTLKKQTFLPVYPLLVLAVVGELRSWRGARGPWLETAACIGLLIHQISEGTPWRDGQEEQRALLRDTLALTKPSESVLDLKGETIFRPRPIYLAYVTATTRGLETGRLAGESPSKLSSTGTAVVIGNGAGLPSDMRKFLKDHYVPVGTGQLRVAGGVIERKWCDGHGVSVVDLPVAGDYLMLTSGEKPLKALTIREPGRQTLEATSGPQLLYWKAAWDAGYRPKVAEISGLAGSSSGGSGEKTR